MAGKPKPTPWDDLNRLVTSTTSERVLAERIEQERRARGWSQERLASEMTKAGVPLHQSAISKIEKPSKADGRRAITVEEAIGFAKVFDLPLLTLLAPSASRDELELLQVFAEGPALKVIVDEVQTKYWQAVDFIARVVDDPVKPWRPRVEEALQTAKRATRARVVDAEDLAARDFYQDVLDHADDLGEGS